MIFIKIYVPCAHESHKVYDLYKFMRLPRRNFIKSMIFIKIHKYYDFISTRKTRPRTGFLIIYIYYKAAYVAGHARPERAGLPGLIPRQDL